MPFCPHCGDRLAPIVAIVPRNDGLQFLVPRFIVEDEPTDRELKQCQPLFLFLNMSHSIRNGPQSDSPGHDSSPLNLKPGVLISSIGLSLMLHLKGYVTLLWSNGIGHLETPEAFCGPGSE